jgi:hypothetical protein
MARNLTSAERASIERQISGATSIARVACGYRIERASIEYTETDRAWFKRPIGGVL